MDPLLIIMLLAVGAMFLLSSRTRKQQRQAGEFRQNLVVGDDVMTGSGLFGTIVDIDGDVVTLESPSGGRTDWLRGAISKLATPPYAEPAEAEDADGQEYEDEMEHAEEGDLAELEDDAVLDEDEESPTSGTPSDDVAGTAPEDDAPSNPRRP